MSSPDPKAQPPRPAAAQERQSGRARAGATSNPDSPGALGLLARLQDLLEEARMRNGASSVQVTHSLAAAARGEGLPEGSLGHAELADCLSEASWVTRALLAELGQEQRRDSQLLEEISRAQPGIAQSLRGIWTELRARKEK